MTGNESNNQMEKGGKVKGVMGNGVQTKSCLFRELIIIYIWEKNEQVGKTNRVYLCLLTSH